MGLQTRLQMRLFEKIEFFKQPDGLSSYPNDGTFDYHFAYRITSTRTYKLPLWQFDDKINWTSHPSFPNFYFPFLSQIDKIYHVS
jgi:hypothetical protein